MPEMGPRSGHALAVRQRAHVRPHHLLVAKRRPPVAVRFLLKLLEGAAAGGDEQGQPGYAVIERRLSGAVHLGQEGSFLPISAVFRIVPIEAADFIGSLLITPIAQVFLDGFLGATVGLLTHNGLGPYDGQLLPWSDRGPFAPIGQSLIVADCVALVLKTTLGDATRLTRENAALRTEGPITAELIIRSIAGLCDGRANVIMRTVQLMVR
eukprot:CAMPEP_0198198520 /NCGR_PEP_ID=MMETSP1445-20131203/1986_1 /TAXON_ID=36898 /ORGANISM="Pyramimonas sp., Strain CCMP2087" /LENGTH=209 /DNA_ID=CAMNT_0043868113 /DNA_START=252 /DNA_END=882 /DNA_ORIENTATION=+